MGKYNLIRVDAPIWTEERHDRAEALIFGEQREWAFNVPAMYQALAAPEIPHPFVRKPHSLVGGLNPFNQEHITARGYWFSLLHLLSFSFGWLKPGAGLEWWLKNDRPTEDHRFALISETWLQDGYLDQILKWLENNSDIRPLFPYANTSFIQSLTPKSNVIHDQELVIALERLQIPNPLTPGYDPLHLAPHLNSSATTNFPFEAQLTVSPTHEPHAVTTLDYMSGFYSQLHKVGERLGEHQSGQSWKVDVFIKKVGYLGTYRRSRKTGLWFAGPHSLHMVGNPHT